MNTTKRKKNKVDEAIARICNECKKLSDYVVSIGEGFYCVFCLVDSYEFIQERLALYEERDETQRSLIQKGLAEQAILRRDLEQKDELIERMNREQLGELKN